MTKNKRFAINFDCPGRMIAAFKKSPKGHFCVWNANICTKSRGKIWYGDIDLTDDIDDLKELAVKENEAIYVLREMDARFSTEINPVFDAAVAVIHPDGTTEKYGSAAL